MVAEHDPRAPNEANGFTRSIVEAASHRRLWNPIKPVRAGQAWTW